MTALTPAQSALVDAMSEVSETAYCAGWLDGTEYEVWRLLHGPPRSWGQAGPELLAPALEAVRVAYRAAGCWILWDEAADGESPVGIERWRGLYARWAFGAVSLPTAHEDRPIDWTAWQEHLVDSSGRGGGGPVCPSCGNDEPGWVCDGTAVDGRRAYAHFWPQCSEFRVYWYTPPPEGEWRAHLDLIAHQPCTPQARPEGTAG
ncbi:hypothetical protein ABTX35_03560 [Streptomyces sp. NPDC096080]|uniref:hypothetical protein n=1 Tax=Streptomyces sp. NPDC096080 TaxID=3156693 RepID=UPI00331EEBDB